METLQTFIASPPSGYFIPPAANLGPIGRSMGSISPNNTATTSSSNSVVPTQEEASNMLAAALGIDTSTINGNTNDEGNTSNDVDAILNGNTNEGTNENASGAGNRNGTANSTANAAPHTKYVSLYVGDLSTTVKDENLFEFFQKEDLKIVTVKVCRDMQTGESLGYGYANFLTNEDAALAIQKLNHKVLYTKPIRLMWSIRDSEARKNGIGNLFVKNLDLSCDDKKLDGMFSKVGKVLSAKVARNNDGSSRGYGFVQFESKEHADAAIETFHDTVVDGKKLSVTHFIRKSDRRGSSPDGFTNLYMKNLDEDIDEELIRLKFSQFGAISSVMIAKDDKGISRGFGFVCFDNPDSAKKAVDTMNGLQLGNRTLYVAKAQKRAEREQFLLSQKQERLKEWHMKTIEANIYVKNLREDVDDMALKNYFSQCGTISSAKVMRNDQGVSKGFGFVCYNSPEEALKAVTTLNRQFFHGKPLYVAQAERKEARKVKLQQQFSATIPTAPYIPPASGYVPAAYTSLYYAPRPNVISPVPYNQGLINQSFPLRPVGTIGTLWRSTGTYFPPPTGPTAYQQVTSPVAPSTPRQRYYNRGRNTTYSQRNFRYQPRSYHQNMRNMGMKYVACGRFDSNYSETMSSAEASTSRTSSMEVGESLCTVPNAPGTIDHQRLQLRDLLFPLVEKFQPELASKIIGHFMEMENEELAALVENPELVPAKMDDMVRLIGIENPSYISAPSAVNQ